MNVFPVNSKNAVVNSFIASKKLVEKLVELNLRYNAWNMTIDHSDYDFTSFSL